jgi:hypothetical protein
VPIELANKLISKCANELEESLSIYELEFFEEIYVILQIATD